MNETHVFFIQELISVYTHTHLTLNAMVLHRCNLLFFVLFLLWWLHFLCSTVFVLFTSFQCILFLYFIIFPFSLYFLCSPSFCFDVNHFVCVCVSVMKRIVTDACGIDECYFSHFVLTNAKWRDSIALLFESLTNVSHTQSHTYKAKVILWFLV